MQDRPSKGELLKIVRTLLRDDVMPRVEGRVRFHVRVAINLLEILERELSVETAQLMAELNAYRTLTGEDAPVDAAGGESLAASVRAANERLCVAIQEGAFDEPARRAALLAFLADVVSDKLAIANPRFLSRVRGT